MKFHAKGTSDKPQYTHKLITRINSRLDGGGSTITTDKIEEEKERERHVEAN